MQERIPPNYHGTAHSVKYYPHPLLRPHDSSSSALPHRVPRPSPLKKIRKKKLRKETFKEIFYSTIQLKDIDCCSVALFFGNSNTDDVHVSRSGINAAVI